MGDGATVLGIAGKSAGGRLAAWMALVSAEERLELPQWRGGTSDLGSQLLDLRNVLSNVIDKYKPSVIAIKRGEAPRGRPSARYDERIMLDAVVRLASADFGRRCAIYRKREIDRAVAGAPAPISVPALSEKQEEATRAAYAALCDLGEGLED